MRARSQVEGYDSARISNDTVCIYQKLLSTELPNMPEEQRRTMRVCYTYQVVVDNDTRQLAVHSLQCANAVKKVHSNLFPHLTETISWSDNAGHFTGAPHTSLQRVSWESTCCERPSDQNENKLQVENELGY